MLALIFVGLVLVLAGHYRARIRAMERNPVVRTRIVPRTMLEDTMGVDWVGQLG